MRAILAAVILAAAPLSAADLPQCSWAKVPGKLLCPDWSEVSAMLPPVYDAAKKKADAACGASLSNFVHYDAAQGAVLVSQYSVKNQNGSFALLFKDGTYLPMGFFDAANGQLPGEFQVGAKARENTKVGEGGRRRVKESFRYTAKNNYQDRFAADRLGYFHSDSVLSIANDTDRSFAERNLLCHCGEKCAGASDGDNNEDPKKKIAECMVKPVTYHIQSKGQDNKDSSGIPLLSIFHCKDGGYVVTRRNDCDKKYSLGLATITPGAGDEAVMDYKWIYDNVQGGCYGAGSVIKNDLDPQIRWMKGFSVIPMKLNAAKTKYEMKSGKFMHCYTSYNNEPSNETNLLKSPDASDYRPLDPKTARLTDIAWDASRKAFCNTQNVKLESGTKESKP